MLPAGIQKELRAITRHWKKGHPSAHQLLHGRVLAWAVDQTVVGR